MEQNDQRMEQEGTSPWDKRGRRFGYHTQASGSESLKVVFDTNILVSASFWYGYSFDAMNFALKGKIICFSSKELVEEFKEVVLRDFFVSEENLSQKMKDLLSIAILVSPSEKVLIINQDLDDNKVLEAAIEAKAQYIVSEDKHLLILKEFRGIKIVSAKKFLNLVDF